MTILKIMHDMCFIKHPKCKKKSTFNWNFVKLWLMDTCTFLCSIGQGLETNLGCFDQALVALWFRSRVFVIFSNIDQVYGSGIEIVRQILQNRPWRINHADTYSRKLFLKGIQKFYYSILRRKKIYRNLYFVYYILYL